MIDGILFYKKKKTPPIKKKNGMKPTILQVTTFAEYLEVKKKRNYNGRFL